MYYIIKSSVLHHYFLFNYKLIFSNREKILNGKDFKKVLGERIIALRASKGLSQERLAECININPRSLSDLEAGKSLPSAETFAKLLDTFGLKPYELFSFPDFKNADEIEAEIYKKIVGIKGNKELLTKIYMYLISVI